MDVLFATYFFRFYSLDNFNLVIVSLMLSGLLTFFITSYPAPPAAVTMLTLPIFNILSLILCFMLIALMSIKLMSSLFLEKIPFSVIILLLVTLYIVFFLSKITYSIISKPTPIIINKVPSTNKPKYCHHEGLHSINVFSSIFDNNAPQNLHLIASPWISSAQ